MLLWLVAIFFRLRLDFVRLRLRFILRVTVQAVTHLIVFDRFHAGSHLLVLGRRLVLLDVTLFPYVDFCYQSTSYSDHVAF